MGRDWIHPEEPMEMPIGREDGKMPAIGGERTILTQPAEASLGMVNQWKRASRAKFRDLEREGEGEVEKG